jgi:hypothetical protein
MRADLTELDGLRPEASARLLGQHARLLRFLRAHAFGDDGQTPAP